MLPWNRNKTKLIEKFEEKEQKYQADLEEKNKLILHYQKQEEEYLIDLTKQQKNIQELQQKLTEYEKREAKYQSRLTVMEIQLNSRLKHSVEVTPNEGTYQLMERISRNSSNNQQKSASSRKTKATEHTMFPPISGNHFSNHTPSQMAQFNPFKNQNQLGR